MGRFGPLVLASLLIVLCGCDLAKTLSKSSHTTAKAPVIRTYSTSDAGHKFIAYVVDVGGKEVVVSDPLGQSSYKAGDTIEFMIQKIEVTGGRKILSFTLLK